MRIRNPWSPLVAFACSSLTFACGDDTTNGTVDWTYDASANDAGSAALTDTGDVTSGGIDLTLPPIGTSSETDPTSDTDLPSLDIDGGSGDTDAGSIQTSEDNTGPASDSTAPTSDGPGTLESDAAVSTDPSETASGDLDAGTQGTSEGEDSTEADGQSTDPQVFIPDGGIVLRPAELDYEPGYLEQLEVPSGFQVQVFSIPGGSTRMLASHGDSIYVTRPQEGDVLRMEDTNADGSADVVETATSGYPMIHGIAFDGDTVFLATPKQLIRGTVAENGSFTELQTLIDDLPDGGQHPLRTLGVGPDGLVYVSVGSTCDACAETNPESATLLQVSQDGTSRTIFASGLRNTLGFDWHPDTTELWGVDNGSDWRGNDLPPEELNLIEAGNDYGWPYCYAKQVVDPIITDPPNSTKAEYCAATTPSVLENQAHEAPLGLVFYEGLGFPEAYQGNAFVAMHGSWNRSPATGYKIVRIVFENGEPTGIEDFVSGFLNDEGLATFGRPAGITVDAEGALLFSDDTNGVIYRVSAEL